MKINKKASKYLLLKFTIICFIINSCNSSNTICIVRPLNKYEKIFIDSLYKSGKDSINIYRYSNNICDKYGDCPYYLEIDNYPLEFMKIKDSTRKEAREIALKIYCDLIEDSIIKHTSEIWIRLKSKKQIKFPYRIVSSYRFSMNDLTKFRNKIEKNKTQGDKKNIVKTDSAELLIKHETIGFGN